LYTEANAGKTKYIFVSCVQIRGRNDETKTPQQIHRKYGEV